MIVNSIFVLSLVALAFSQYQRQSKDAAILSEARYLAVNGQFGASYKQEDGVEFKEESDDQGNRRGSYSYVDPSGVRRTVHYTAGKDGFKATGDHIPVPPVPVVPPTATSAPQVPVPLSTENDNSNDDYDDGLSKSYQPQYNNYNNYKYQFQEQFPAPAPLKSASHYNPSPQSQFNPLQFQFQSTLPPIPHVPTYHQISSESPHRLSPPGKLSVNRSPDGYSYTFNKI